MGEQRRRIERIFAEVHTAVLKPRGFSRKKLWSIRRGEVLAYVNIELTPWAHDEYYPVELTYGINLPAGTEPIDLMWGISDTLMAPDGRPVYSLHWVLDERELVEEFSNRLPAEVLPFLDAFAAPSDLVDFLAGQPEVGPRFQPFTPKMRAQSLAYFAGAAGRLDVAEAARVAVIEAGIAEGMEQYVPEWLAEIDEMVERYRANH